MRLTFVVLLLAATCRAARRRPRCSRLEGDVTGIQTWIEAYVRAWNSNDPDGAGRCTSFTEYWMEQPKGS